MHDDVTIVTASDLRAILFGHVTGDMITGALNDLVQRALSVKF